MHHELAGGAFENSLQHVSRQLPLSLLRRQACFIDVRPLGFVSPNRPFCRHNLQKFQDAGVPHGLFLQQRVVHFPNRGGPSSPENTQNFKLRDGGFLWRMLHEADDTTKTFVVSTKTFVLGVENYVGGRTANPRPSELRLRTMKYEEKYGEGKAAKGVDKR